VNGLSGIVNFIQMAVLPTGKRKQMRLVQFLSESGQRQVAKVEKDETSLNILTETTCIYDLALEAGRSRSNLADMVDARLSNEWADYEKVIASKRLLPPLDHPDPAHCFITGTGLTHLGSAQARDAMHTKKTKEQSDKPVTDSMRIFQWGLEGGKPADGQISVQPEWFYKGNGYNVVAPEQPLESPPFALDSGEEAELAGLYVISKSGEVLRVGFALGNEFSDHVMEAQNYLYLAHSKLRQCSFGPELLVGELPNQISGQVCIHRDGKILWEAPFQTGEDHMSYTIANLEHHHFKYPIFRHPGDVHIHFFGTATLSKNAGITTQPGDQFEISAPEFGRPLRNQIIPSGDSNNRIEITTL
jgi:hypothetical protein